MEYPNYQGIPQGIGVHQKVWGKMFLIYLIKKLLRSIGQLKMILKKNKSGCPTLFDALLICRLIICFGLILFTEFGSGFLGLPIRFEYCCSWGIN